MQPMMPSSTRYCSSTDPVVHLAVMCLQFCVAILRCNFRVIHAEIANMQSMHTHRSMKVLMSQHYLVLTYSFAWFCMLTALSSLVSFHPFHPYLQVCTTHYQSTTYTCKCAGCARAEPGRSSVRAGSRGSLPPLPSLGPTHAPSDPLLCRQVQHRPCHGLFACRPRSRL